ncbi:MAG: type IV pilin protein [Nitrospiraceae bacterium]
MPSLRSSKGYSLIELMMVVVIIGLLASFAIPKYEGYIEKARIARSIAEIRYFERDIEGYYVEHEKYPNSLEDLGRSLNNLLDPWGNPYQYLLLAGTNFVSNGGGGLYAHGRWTPDIITAAAGSEHGFWSGSWFFSEAWATPPPPPPPPSASGVGCDGGGSPKPRKDRFLKPVSSDYDLYSMGPDGQCKENLNHKDSRDDIVRASDGAFVGVAENF